MTLYFDSSALVKLVLEEAESSALERYARRHRTYRHVVSALARTEVIRAVAAAGTGRIEKARRVLRRVDQFPVTEALLDAAAELPYTPLLRTLDAIHVATAQAIPDLLALVTYDDRMRAAAEALGLPVASP